jgi:hypothetical protein
MTPQTIYLATSGEYSDYGVRHAFARKEDAEAYPLGDHVEEYELHDGPVEVRTWHVLYWDPVQPDHEKEAGRYGNPWMDEHLQDFGGKPGNISHRWEGRYHAPEIKKLRVEGWDPDRVRKVYSEQRAQYKAQEAGL